jgi:hypothetical protein
MLQKEGQVKLHPAVLEDPSLQSNHHLIRRMLKEEVTGKVLRAENEKYWVQFTFFRILLSDQHLVLV